jgi:hypothetical protein
LDYFPQNEPDESAPEVFEPVVTVEAPKEEEVPVENSVFFAAIKRVFGLNR